jgi:hypothetical protein
MSSAQCLCGSAIAACVIVLPCLSICPQGMVARSELLEALSEAKSNIEDTTMLATTNTKQQEQLDTARTELAHLKDAMLGMVTADTLESEKKRSKDLEQAARAERQKLEEALAALNEKLRALNSDKAALEAQIQVREENQSANRFFFAPNLDKLSPACHNVAG